MTIQQLEAFSNTKPELRYITEEIIKYLGANPGGSPGGSSYLVYTALLTQTGTGVPTIIELQNTTGGTVTPTYTAMGDFKLTGSINNMFPVNKTMILIGSPYTITQQISAIHYEDVDEKIIKIQTGQAGTDANDILYLTAIEIRVYP